MKIKGRSISKGVAEGEVLFSPEPISFLGGVDPKTGRIREPDHPLFGKSVAGKVLAFPCGKGSTVGTYVLYQLKMNGKAPAAIINEEAEIIVALGAVISGIPMVDKINIDRLRSGMRVRVDGTRGDVEIIG